MTVLGCVTCHKVNDHRPIGVWTFLLLLCLSANIDRNLIAVIIFSVSARLRAILDCCVQNARLLSPPPHPSSPYILPQPCPQLCARSPPWSPFPRRIGPDR